MDVYRARTGGRHQVRPVAGDGGRSREREDSSSPACAPHSRTSPAWPRRKIAAGIVPRDLGDAFFLVDPLDGTRNSSTGATDFTVNIALVRDGVPEIGVVFAPCTRPMLFRPARAWRRRSRSRGDYRSTAAGGFHVQHRLSRRSPSSPAARTGRRKPTLYIRHLQAAEIVSVGSSLKFCLIASAEADRLSALRPHDGVGHGGRRRGAARGRRHDAHARRPAAHLRQARPSSIDDSQPDFRANPRCSFSLPGRQVSQRRQAQAACCWQIKRTLQATFAQGAAARMTHSPNSSRYSCGSSR